MKFRALANQPAITMFVTYFAPPFAFLYLGGWKVFLPVSVGLIGFTTIIGAITPDVDLLASCIFPRLIASNRFIDPIGLVLFQHVLRYQYVLNRFRERGQDLGVIKSFKWGWYCWIVMMPAIVTLLGSGAAFKLMLSETGNPLKASVVALLCVYVLWIVFRRLKNVLMGFLADKFGASKEEFVEYHPFRYPAFLL